MPGRAVHSCLVGGVDILSRAASPKLPACGQLQFDHALGSQVDRHNAVEALRCRWHKNPGATGQRSLHVRTAHDLLEVRRADFLLALRHQNQVQRQLSAGAADRVESGKQSGLRTFLVDRASTDEHLAEPRLVEERSVPGWR